MGVVGDAGDLVDRRRPAVGAGRLPPLHAPHRSVRDARGVRIARRGGGDAHRGTREFRARPGGAGGAPARAAAGGRDPARGGVARRAVRQHAILAAAARRDRGRAAVRRPGDGGGGGAGNAAIAPARAVAGRACARAGVRHRVARPGRAAICRFAPIRQRRGRGEAVGVAERVSAVVPAGAGAHGDLGRRPEQGGAGRRRAAGPVAPPLFCQVARSRRTHVRPMERRGPGRGAADRRHGQGRHPAVPLGGHADRAAAARPGAPAGRDVGAPGGGGGRGRADPVDERGVPRRDRPRWGAARPD